jgi:hypothetical protein
MLKFLGFTAALSVACVTFLPEVAFGLPPVVDINNSPTVILDPINNYDRVIVNPINRFPTRRIYPINNYGTVNVYPNNRFPTRRVYPINNYGTVNVNPNPQQPSCGSMIYGSPIPSPVPVNPYTGHRC